MWRIIQTLLRQCSLGLLMGVSLYCWLSTSPAEARCRWVCKYGRHCTSNRRCYTKYICSPRKNCNRVEYYLIDREGKRVKFKKTKCEKLKLCKHQKICRRYQTCRRQKRCVRVCGKAKTRKKQPIEPQPVKSVVKPEPRKSDTPLNTKAPPSPQCRMNSSAKKLWNFLNLERMQSGLKPFRCTKDLQKVARNWGRRYCRTGRVPYRRRWEILQDAGVYPRKIQIMKYRTFRRSVGMRRWQKRANYKKHSLSKVLDQIGISSRRCGRRRAWVVILVQSP